MTREVCVVFWAVVLSLASAIDAAAATRQGPFGGEFRVKERGPHLSEELRAEIRGRIDRNIAILKELGLLGEAAIDEPGPRLSRPLRGAAALRDFDAYTTVYFVDQRFQPGLLDYGCDTRTYDGHRGTDYGTWPFNWLKMDQDLVEVVLKLIRDRLEEIGGGAR